MVLDVDTRHESHPGHDEGANRLSRNRGLVSWPRIQHASRRAASKAYNLSLIINNLALKVKSW